MTTCTRSPRCGVVKVYLVTNHGGYALYKGSWQMTTCTRSPRCGVVKVYLVTNHGGYALYKGSWQMTTCTRSPRCGVVKVYLVTNHGGYALYKEGRLHRLASFPKVRTSNRAFLRALSLLFFTLGRPRSWQMKGQFHLQTNLTKRRKTQVTRLRLV